MDKTQRKANGMGQVMWRIGEAWVIGNVLEWQKLERNGVPWQSTFFKEDGTHSDSDQQNRVQLMRIAVKYVIEDVICPKNTRLKDAKKKTLKS